LGEAAGIAGARGVRRKPIESTFYHGLHVDERNAVANAAGL